MTELNSVISYPVSLLQKTSPVITETWTCFAHSHPQHPAQSLAHSAQGSLTNTGEWVFLQDATFLPPKKFLFQNQFVNILLIPTMGILSSLARVHRGLSNHKMHKEAQEVIDILPC